MEKKANHSSSNALSLLEMLLSGIVSWIVKRILDFMWKDLKTKRTSRRKRESLFIRFSKAYLHLMAALLGVNSVELKFVMERAKKFGVLKGGFKFLYEIMTYSLH